MSTTTNKVVISSEAYTNVSNGNLNVTVFIEQGYAYRACVSGEEPAVDTDLHVKIAYGDARIFSVTNLVEEDDLWIRLEDEGEDEMIVMRGNAHFAIDK